MLETCEWFDIDRRVGEMLEMCEWFESESINAAVGEDFFLPCIDLAGATLKSAHA